jgi:3'-5' exonuclease
VLLERACERRNAAIQSQKEGLNPELECIFTLNLEETETDYLVNFTLNLLEAVSVHEGVPSIVCRIIINNLSLQISDEEIIITPKHQEMALSKLECIRSEIIFDYVQKLRLSPLVDNSRFLDLAKSHVEKNKYHDAAIIIHKFKFIKEFDCLKIIDRLVDSNRIPSAKLLCSLDNSLILHLIKQLSTNDNCKIAAQIIDEYKLDINDFPELQERLQKQTMRYYLGRFLYKKPKTDDYLSLDRIEDLFFGFKSMLSYLVEDLVHKGKMNEAKGVCLRHNLMDIIRPDTREQLIPVVYDQKRDPVPYDAFGPLSDGKCIEIPPGVTVEMISTLDDIKKLDALLVEPYIGVDSEWRPSLTKFHHTAPALFQISGAAASFLVDLVSLRDSKELNEKLVEVFTNDKSVIVGFAFNSDIDMFARRLPKHFTFYRYIKRFIDLQSYYSRVHLAPAQTGLAKVCSRYLGCPSARWSKCPTGSEGLSASRSSTMRLWTHSSW